MAALSKALKDAQAAYVQGEAALRKGDFAAYGQAQAELKDALQRAVAASPQGKATAKPYENHDQSSTRGGTRSATSPR